MTLSAIIGSILSKLDELTPFNEGLVLSDDNELLNPIKRYINEFLPDCCTRTLRAARYHVLPLTNIPGDKPNVDRVVSVELPSDFIRIGSVNFPSWERPVFEAITPEHPDYILQRNKYTRGGNAKPVVVLAKKDDKKILECYSVNTGENATVMTYVGTKTPEQMPDELIPALGYLVASEVLKATEKYKEAEQALGSFTASIINL